VNILVIGGSIFDGNTISRNDAQNKKLKGSINRRFIAGLLTALYSFAI